MSSWRQRAKCGTRHQEGSLHSFFHSCGCPHLPSRSADGCWLAMNRSQFTKTVTSFFPERPRQAWTRETETWSLILAWKGHSAVLNLRFLICHTGLLSLTSRAAKIKGDRKCQSQRTEVARRDMDIF